MDKLIRMHTAGRQPMSARSEHYYISSCTAQRYYVHDGETFVMEHKKSRGTLFTMGLDWDKSELCVVIYSGIGVLKWVRSTLCCCVEDIEFCVGIADETYEVDAPRSYEEFIAYLAAGRKYHEHAGNVYIAVTKWRFTYPTDCAIEFAR